MKWRTIEKFQCLHLQYWPTSHLWLINYDRKQDCVFFCYQNVNTFHQSVFQSLFHGSFISRSPVLFSLNVYFDQNFAKEQPKFSCNGLPWIRSSPELKWKQTYLGAASKTQDALCTGSEQFKLVNEDISFGAAPKIHQNKITRGRAGVNETNMLQ